MKASIASPQVKYISRRLYTVRYAANKRTQATLPLTRPRLENPIKDCLQMGRSSGAQIHFIKESITFTQRKSSWPPSSFPTNSRVCLATWKAMGGIPFVNSFHLFASLIPSSSAPTSVRRSLSSAKESAVGSAPLRRASSLLSVMAIRASEIVLDRMETMASIFDIIVAGISSARILSTRDVIAWTRSSVCSSRKAWRGGQHLEATFSVKSLKQWESYLELCGFAIRGVDAEAWFERSVIKSIMG